MTIERIKYVTLAAVATGLAWALQLSMELWSWQWWLVWGIGIVVVQPIFNFVRDTWPWRKRQRDPYQLIPTSGQSESPSG